MVNPEGFPSRPRNTPVPSYRPIQPHGWIIDPPVITGFGGGAERMPEYHVLSPGEQSGHPINSIAYQDFADLSLPWSSQILPKRPGQVPPAFSYRLQLDSGINRSLPLSTQKSLHIKGLTSLQHVVDRSPQFVGQNGKGFSLTMLAGKPVLVLKSLRITSQEQYRSFRECPLQMNITDLAACGTIPFSC